MATATLLLLALSLAAHDQSEGRATFRVEGHDVAVTIALSTVDLPELCPSFGAEAVRHDDLDPCIDAAVRSGVRVRAAPSMDALATQSPAACPWRSVDARLGGDQGGASGARSVTIEARARCPEAPRALVVDWGLFAGTRLDFTAVTRVVPPSGWFAPAPSLHLLSKRHNKLVVDVGQQRRVAVGVGLLAGVGVVLIGVGLRRWRRGS
jgi:hypothetical protein